MWEEYLSNARSQKPQRCIEVIVITRDHAIVTTGSDGFNRVRSPAKIHQKMDPSIQNIALLFHSGTRTSMACEK